jgi:NADH/F420H2 dehydrogenase subunit C
MVSSDDLINIITAKFPDSVEDASEVFGTPTIYVRAESIVGICDLLKKTPSCKFDYLMSLSASDWPDRFDMVYHLYSIDLKHYVTLKVRMPKGEPAIIDSVFSVWKAADWQEREVYDMFGIEFNGHPDLRRILLEPDWDGFPLRKDYVEK